MRFYYDPEVAKNILVHRKHIFIGYTKKDNIRNIFTYTSKDPWHTQIVDNSIIVKDIDTKNEKCYSTDIIIPDDIINNKNIFLLLNNPIRFNIEYIIDPCDVFSYEKLNKLIYEKFLSILNSYNTTLTIISSNELDPIYVVELYDNNNCIVSNRYKVKNSLELLKYLSDKRYIIKSIRKEKRNNKQKFYRVLK